MNDAVILLCGVILLAAVLPMFLMKRAFKGAGSRKKEAVRTDGTLIATDPGSAKAKSGHTQDDSGSSGSADGGDGGGGGE